MKKLVMWLIVALMTIAGSLAAMADEVPPAEAKPVAGYDGGFFIQNPEGTFKFTINGRLQPIYYYTKSSGSESATSFKLRRAQLVFSSLIAEKGHTEIVLLHSTGSAYFGKINVFSATAGLKVAPELDIIIGTTGVPLNLLVSSSGIHFFDVPLALTQEDGGTVTPMRSAFGNPDGIGIEFTGEVGKFLYDFAVVNGAAAPVKAQMGVDPNGNAIEIEGASGGVESNYDLNFHKRVSVGGRVAYNILDGITPALCDLPYSEKPKLTVSMGANYQGTRQDPNNDVIVSRILTGALGAGFRWRGLAVTSELFGRKTKIADPGTAVWFSSTMDDVGYYIDSGYFVIRDKLEVAGLVSQIFREGTHNDSYQFGSSLNWYIKANKLKTQLLYTLSGTYSDITNQKTTKAHYLGLGLNAAF